MQLIPVTLKAANEFIKAKHRHHGKVRGCKFSIGIRLGGEIVGVAVTGRPVSRMLDDGLTAEVTRLCADGTKNVCSKLYAASARAAFAMGYTRIVTYILVTESGVSLKAAGWVRSDQKSIGGSWDRPSRNRDDRHPLIPKFRYEKCA